MEKEIQSIIIQNIGALTMALVFIYYLTRRDRETSDSFEKFNNTVQNHLAHALKVEIGLTKALTKLTDCISHLKRK